MRESEIKREINEIKEMFTQGKPKKYTYKSYIRRINSLSSFLFFKKSIFYSDRVNI